MIGTGIINRSADWLRRIIINPRCQISLYFTWQPSMTVITKKPLRAGFALGHRPTHFVLCSILYFRCCLFLNFQRAFLSRWNRYTKTHSTVQKEDTGLCNNTGGRQTTVEVSLLALCIDRTSFSFGHTFNKQQLLADILHPKKGLVRRWQTHAAAANNALLSLLTSYCAWPYSTFLSRFTAKTHHHSIGCR